MKIFINIASYRDIFLATTINDAYNNAEYKDSLVFGVVDQAYLSETIDISSFDFYKQIRYIRLDPEHSRGACWARHMAQTLYNDEDYYLQIDSHTIFDAGWDKTLIDRYEDICLHHDKPIMTGYPYAFYVKDNDLTKLEKQTGNSVLTLTIVANETFQNGDYYVRQKGDHLYDLKTVHGFLVAGGFIFTKGRIVEEVPYDPYMYFNGEEPSLALRAWTWGYSIFHIDEIPLYHHYNDPKVGGYNRKPPWGDTETINKKIIDHWYDLESISKRRFINTVTGQDIGIYSLGKVRTLKQYIEWSGIDYLNKTINENAINGNHTFQIPYSHRIN